MNLNCTIANFMAQMFDDGLITDDTNITIKDYRTGETLSSGHWYHDNVLDWITKKTPRVIYYMKSELRTGNEGIDTVTGDNLQIEIKL